MNKLWLDFWDFNLLLTFSFLTDAYCMGGWFASSYCWWCGTCICYRSLFQLVCSPVLWFKCCLLPYISFLQVPQSCTPQSLIMCMSYVGLPYLNVPLMRLQIQRSMPLQSTFEPSLDIIPRRSPTLDSHLCYMVSWTLMIPASQSMPASSIMPSSSL